ncbi:MAG: phage recombination protein Bet [Patescibacteria group bacterium]|nr:phage recombination protein Bet [Patescibacteria group bacterium]
MTFTKDQVSLIKRTICRGASDDEFALFIYACKHMGLDPLARQAHAVKRWDSSQQRDVMAIQIGIDGFRLIAERTGKYAPGKEPSFVEKDGQVISATAHVKKYAAGEWHEVSATAHYSEYAAKTKEGVPTKIWSEKPHVMIAKCAEALALRRAFPSELSGVYTDDEMGSVDNPAADHAPEKKPAPTPTAPTAANEASVTFIPSGVKVYNGVSKGGKEYTKFAVEHPQGTLYSTFEAAIAELAREAAAKEIPLEVKFVQNGRYFNITSANLAEVAQESQA